MDWLGGWAARLARLSTGCWVLGTAYIFGFVWVCLGLFGLFGSCGGDVGVGWGGWMGKLDGE